MLHSFQVPASENGWRRPRSGTAAGSGLLEIDVTPVMNLFMILIPFLVSMAFFSHLAVQSFRLPPSEGTGQAQTDRELPWTVAISAEGIALTRGEWIVGTAGHLIDERGYDYQKLAKLLAGAHLQYPESERVIVAVDDGIRAAEIVAVLDHCREAGFGNVGLAEGTGWDGLVGEGE